MSTEEKITENKETTELSKPKRRFKLDKKHIQGFVAGLLVAAIAFTGLYYGTNGFFFVGAVSGEVPVVTDANFEGVLEQSDSYIIVASSNYVGNNRIKDYNWRREVQSLDVFVKVFIRNKNLNFDKLVIYELDPGKSENVINEHFSGGTHFTVFYNGQKIHASVQAWEVSSWFNQRSQQRLL